jgi:hypothetical protein
MKKGEVEEVRMTVDGWKNEGDMGLLYNMT